MEQDKHTTEQADSENTTVLEPVETETPVEDNNTDRGKRKRRIIIIACSAVVVALLAAGGVYAGVNAHYQSMVEPAYAGALKADSTLTSSMSVAEQLVKTDKSKVADGKVLTALKAALDKAKKQAKVAKLDVNSLLVWQATHASGVYDADKTSADSARVSLDKAIKAVRASIEVKELADAKQALTGKINAAKQTLADSDGKVADNATRDALQQAVDAANKVLADSKATVKTLQAEPSKLDAAVNTVNQSVEAKRKADEEAAAKAAAEEAARQAAAAAAQASTPSYSGYSSSYSGSSYTAPRSTYSSGGSTTPRSTYTAPQQSTPQSSGGVIDRSSGYGTGVTWDTCDAACRAESMKPIQH